jgi:hypothetical protein
MNVKPQFKNMPNTTGFTPIIIKRRTLTPLLTLKQLFQIQTPLKFSAFDFS